MQDSVTFLDSQGYIYDQTSGAQKDERKKDIIPILSISARTHHSEVTPSIH